jgi:hypothetical protein
MIIIKNKVVANDPNNYIVQMDFLKANLAKYEWFIKFSQYVARTLIVTIPKVSDLYYTEISLIIIN